MALTSPADQIPQDEMLKRRHAAQARRIARLERRMIWTVRRVRFTDAMLMRNRPRWARLGVPIAFAAIQMAALTILFVWGIG
jgi:hypothetical protein